MSVDAYQRLIERLMESIFDRTAIESATLTPCDRTLPRQKKGDDLLWDRTAPKKQS